MAARKKSPAKSGTLIDVARVVSVGRNRSGPKRIKASPQRAERRPMRLRGHVVVVQVYDVVDIDGGRDFRVEPRQAVADLHSDDELLIQGTHGT